MSKEKVIEEHGPCVRKNASMAIRSVLASGYDDIYLYCGRGAYALIGDVFALESEIYHTFPTQHLADYDVMATPTHEIPWPSERMN